MCSRWMYCCSELFACTSSRMVNLRNLVEQGCSECATWAAQELVDDKKITRSVEVEEEN